MLGISYATERKHNLIRFPHPTDPSTLFFLESGRNIIFHDSYDHKPYRFTCYHCPGDCMHFKFGHRVYHINEFAEVMARNGHTYEPADPISDLSLFEKKYLDRALTGNDGQIIPYRMLWHNNDVFMGVENWYSRQMPVEDRRAICICPDANVNRKVCLIDGEFNKDFMSIEALRSRLPDIPMKSYELRQILSSALEVERSSNSLDNKLKAAKHRAAGRNQKTGTPAPVQDHSR